MADKELSDDYPLATGCQRCGTSLLLLVDGQEMTEDQLVRLLRAPRKIERRVVHRITCDSFDHRMQLLASSHSASNEQEAEG